MSFYQEIETERLLLRKPMKKDHIFQYNYQKDSANYPFADIFTCISFKEIEIYFDRMLEGIKNRDSLFWIVENKETLEPLGTISAWNIDVEKNSIEFGYSLYPNARGNGYMFETIKAVIKYCHTALGFTVFDIWTNKDNYPSIKLAKKLGFIHTGFVEEKAKHTNTTIVYSTYQIKYLDRKDYTYEKF